MDDETTVQELKAQVKEFCDKREWDQFHDPKELAIALSIEASELLEHFRWLNKSEVKEKFKSKRSDIEGELADVFYLALRIAQMENIDVSQALKTKMKENNQKYPVGKSKGQHKKYDEL